jgi:predicted lipoprotein with Yx(FWY)xxD motif
MVRHRGWAAAALIAAALTVTACGKANSYSGGGTYSTPTTSSSATPAYGYGNSGTAGTAGTTATLKAEATRAGTVLASPKGLTLYYYTEDKRGSGRSVCTAGCAAAWPPLIAPVSAPSGVQLPGPIGAITRSDGTKQVTINGFPVYRYADDTTPGQAAGNGVEGSWHVIKIHVAAATTTRTLKVTQTSAGPVLASPKGLTLYYYTEDKRGSGRSVCTAGCAAAWPPLIAPVSAPSGVHLPGPVGEITRSDGTKQVTINGYPIYRYADDKAPGQATGNGAEGAWHVIKIP